MVPDSAVMHYASPIAGSLGKVGCSPQEDDGAAVSPLTLAEAPTRLSTKSIDSSNRKGYSLLHCFSSTDSSIFPNKNAKKYWSKNGL